jgi:hypothetical protein
MVTWRGCIALFALPAVLTGQRPDPTHAADLIAQARGQLRVNRADSARSLLQLAADEATGGRVGDRQQAYVLLGVLEYIARHDSSAAALAFRLALRLDPGLQAGGLAQVDSALERILAAERRALGGDSAPALPPADSAVHDCVRRCRNGEVKPDIIERRSFAALDPTRMAASQTRGEIAVRFVVGLRGAAQPESIRITANTAPGYADQVLEAVRGLRFRPATLNGAPVRAAVELRFEFRTAGYNTIDYSITGP